MKYWQEILSANPDKTDLTNQPEQLVEESKPNLKEPSLYRVVLLNDDYTPMDFVINILIMLFRMTEDEATRVMLAVHTQGKGSCRIFTRDIAETKAMLVNQHARKNKHPLLCKVEKDQ